MQTLNNSGMFTASCVKPLMP